MPRRARRGMRGRRILNGVDGDETSVGTETCFNVRQSTREDRRIPKD